MSIFGIESFANDLFGTDVFGDEAASLVPGYDEINGDSLEIYGYEAISGLNELEAMHVIMGISDVIGGESDSEEDDEKDDEKDDKKDDKKWYEKVGQWIKDMWNRLLNAIVNIFKKFKAFVMTKIGNFTKFYDNNKKKEQKINNSTREVKVALPKVRLDEVGKEIGMDLKTGADLFDKAVTELKGIGEKFLKGDGIEPEDFETLKNIGNSDGGVSDIGKAIDAIIKMGNDVLSPGKIKEMFFGKDGNGKDKKETMTVKEAFDKLGMNFSILKDAKKWLDSTKDAQILLKRTKNGLSTVINISKMIQKTSIEKKVAKTIYDIAAKINRAITNVSNGLVYYNSHMIQSFGIIKWLSKQALNGKGKEKDDKKDDKKEDDKKED